MENEHIRQIVEENYSLSINNIEKIKNVYRIEAEDRLYCLKIIKYEFKHFLFIISAIKHLQHNGFENIPEFISSKNHEEYICIDNKHAYLTPWVNARECNYDNPVDIRLATVKLSELHKKSLNFNVTPNMQPRIGWLKWIKTFETRQREILDFRRRIFEKNCKTEFDNYYLKVMDEELARSQRAIGNLSKSNYIENMKKEIKHRGFCHHDYAHHNVLVEKDGSVNIIDFDYCILDTHLHDLSSFLIRRMKGGKWSLENALFIMEVYNSINLIYQEDIPIMAAFMEFPQAYWQIGIQYYWEKQPWGDEFFMNKLEKMCEDRKDKQIFIDEFREIKYGR